MWNYIRVEMFQFQEFIHMNYDNDILVAVHIVKTPVKITYLSQRNTATDFPVIAVAVSEYNEKLHVSIGARPVRAETLTLDLSEKADMEHLVKKSAGTVFVWKQPARQCRLQTPYCRSSCKESLCGK